MVQSRADASEPSTKFEIILPSNLSSVNLPAIFVA
jgi:hypothetical protein